MTKFKTVDEYISIQPPEIAARLTELRKLFHALLPDTKESIRYQIPAFTVGNYYLYISAYKHHIGMYPISEISGLNEEILLYRGKGTKDSLHFKHTEPLPLDFIKKIILAKSKKTNQD